MQVGLEVRAILIDILFLLILVEVFRLPMYYLVERHVAVGTMVETGIISVLLVTLGALRRYGRLRRGRERGRQPGPSRDPPHDAS